MVPSAGGELDSPGRRQVPRRSFLKGLGMAGATLLPASALLVNQAKAMPSDDSGGKLSKGDASILRFLCAAEILESDLWEQYWELGGLQPGAPQTIGKTNEDFESTNPATPGAKPKITGGNTPYTNGLLILDGDMPQYIQDNTDDEFSHANFLIAYLAAKGASITELLRLTGTGFARCRAVRPTAPQKKDG